MVYRFSWIAGATAIGLAFWELSSLLRSSVTGTPWQVAILAATLLGVGITWTAIAYRAPAWVVIGANVVAFVILAGFILAPDTLFGILPTNATWTVLVDELNQAFDIIQHGVEPVRSRPGLVVLISLLFWTLGFLLTAGLLNDRPFVAVLTPLIVAVQFAIIDRRPKGLLHLALFILIVAFALIAIRADERDRGAGRLQRVNASRPPSKRPTPAVGALISGTVVAGLVAVAVFGGVVPTDGFVTWRSPAGYSDEYSGSVAYNPFTDILAGLNESTDNSLFTADIAGADPTTVRFRTVTLDVYANGRWMTDRIHAFPLGDEPWIYEDQQYRGPTIPISADITIQNLGQTWMPAPSTPTAAAAVDGGDEGSMQVRRLDGSLILRGDRTYPGMEYSVQTEVPMYDRQALATLARTENGDLSPLFQAAAAAGETIPGTPIAPVFVELENHEKWVETPDDLGAGVRLRALDVTENLDTNFAKALALEYYFRDSGQFTYNTHVPPENTTGDVSAWLTDESNPFVRHGYCEQFSTAMALMARSIGIPSRVVLGFTAGELIEGTTTVQVRDRNAHAWVEMWIPSHGWMSFDPTPRGGFAAQTANDSVADELGFSPAAYAAAIPDPETTPPDAGDGSPTGPLNPAEQEREGEFFPGGSDETDSGFSISLPGWLSALLAIAAIIGIAMTAIPVAKAVRRRRRLKRLVHGDISAAWDDVVERLSDLRAPVDAAATPMEAAESVDEALIPLARSYGQSIYGERESTSAVIERASSAHGAAVRHLTNRYSMLERFRAAFRPTRLLENWNYLMGRRNGRNNR